MTMEEALPLSGPQFLNLKNGISSLFLPGRLCGFCGTGLTKGKLTFRVNVVDITLMQHVTLCKSLLWELPCPLSVPLGHPVAVLWEQVLCFSLRVVPSLEEPSPRLSLGSPCGRVY